ncbi:MAG: MFS transporter [Gemmatimonadota bacterium]
MTLSAEQVSDRLDRLPTSRFHAQILVIAAVSLLFDTLDSVLTGFVLATLRTTWGFGVGTIGWISALGMSGYLVGSLCSGFIADRIGRKRTILTTLILYSVFSASRGFATSVPMLATLNFFTFIFIGAESSTVPPYLAELWPARDRGALSGWMMSFFGLGIALAPVWALLIIPVFGWRWAFFLTAPFALIGGLMRSGLPESPRWLARMGRGEEAEEVVAWIEARVERSTRAPLPVVSSRPSLASPKETGRIGPRDLLGGPYRRITLMLWSAWFAEYGVLHTFQTFVPTILASEGYTIVRSFRYSVVIYLAVVPGYVLGGRVSDWLDRKYAVLLSFAGVGIFGTLFGRSTSPLTITVFGGLTTFFLALGSTAIYTYTPELYPTEVRATGMGIASAWGRVGSIALLLLLGRFFAVYGRPLLYIASDAMLVVAAVMVMLFGPLTSGRKLEETSLAP